MLELDAASEDREPSPLIRLIDPASWVDEFNRYIAPMRGV